MNIINNNKYLNMTNKIFEWVTGFIWAAWLGGAISAFANITFSDWQFWVIIGPVIVFQAIEKNLAIKNRINSVVVNINKSMKDWVDEKDIEIAVNGKTVQEKSQHLDDMLEDNSARFL